MTANIKKEDLLTVPIALDGLFVSKNGFPVLDPFADFSHLPYIQKNDEGRLVSINEGTPYLSEAILSRPFNDQNSLLEPGIHLHWSLPDALTRAEHKIIGGEESIVFPAVPNRWLVLRRSKQRGLDNCSWMVHSDFLWPEGKNPGDLIANKSEIQFPKVTHHHQTPDGPDSLPFRFQGLVYKYYGQKNTPIKGGDYINKLTAVGYGEPLYAALYPNCRGVFGIWDNLDDLDPATVDLRDIEYHVYGWYEQASKDILRKFVTTFSTEKYNGLEIDSALQAKFGWSIHQKSIKSIPGRILCRAELNFSRKAAPKRPKTHEHPFGIQIGVGNTGTEALSAFVAQRLGEGDPTQQLMLENQLESLHLKIASEDHFVDLGPLFEEYRHNKSFQPISGGRLWALKPESAEDAGLPNLRDFHIDLGAATLFLPGLFDEILDMCNTLQKRFNQANAGIEFLQRQIFTDWHKYMVCCYHEEKQGDYPDIDSVKIHIEKLMDLLTLLKTYAGKINYSKVDGRWSTNETAEITDLPNPEGLFHLLPQNVPLFYNWCQGLVREEVGNSIAFEIAERLNYMAGALQFRARLIHALRSFIPTLEIEEMEIDLSTLEHKVQQIQRLIFESKESIEVVLPDFTLIRELKDIKNKFKGQPELLNEVKEWLVKRMKPLITLPVLQLHPVKAPRYYQPNEPVVLLAGPAVATTNRHGTDGEKEADGLLSCKYLKAKYLSNVIRGKYLRGDKHFTQKSDANHWHALFFEWEVGVENLGAKSNRDPSTLAYQPDFITHQFKLEETRSEFLVQNQNTNTQDSSAYFSGRSVLLPYAEQQLFQQIEDYLISKTRQFLLTLTEEKKDLDSTETALLKTADRNRSDRRTWLKYFTDNETVILSFFDRLHQDDLVKAFLSAPVKDLPQNKISAAERERRSLLLKFNPSNVDTTSFWGDNEQTIIEWLNENSEAKVQYTSILHILLRVEKQLSEWRQKGVHFQTQALGGFNRALMMLNESLQLEVAEPNTTVEYRSFSNRVARAAGKFNQAIGFPNLDFHPLRTGKMTISRLRIVDTFGRVHPVVDLTTNDQQIAIAKPERLQSEDHKVLLAARISQAARLNFRLLSSDENEVEVNDHPFTSPICGWVIPNHIDQSLAFYDGRGGVLGSIDQTGKWRVFPGEKSPVLAEDIPNAYLRKLGQWIIEKASESADFVIKLVDEWEQILEGIDPAGFSQHQARSLLMGRPMALIELSVDIELQGWPVVHQDWNHFRKVIEDGNYSTDAFTEVEIPIRIGEKMRLQDGVVSFWLDKGRSFSREKYCPLHGSTFTQAISSPMQRIAALVDPRGAIHCTTGILPTKAITIPREQYTEALRKIQISFQVSPVITSPRQLNLGLPEEAGFTWAWLQKDNRQWTQLTERPVLEEQEVLAAFPDGIDIWNRLFTNGWLELIPNRPHLAFLRPPGERTKDDLSLESDTSESKSVWKERQIKIERILDHLSRGIKAPIMNATVAPTQEIREGWLALRPLKGFDDTPLT